MRMPSGIVAEGLDSHHHAGDAVFEIKMLPEEIDQAPVGAETELAQQFAVIEEITAKNDRDTEDILPVRYRVQQVFP